MTTEAGAEQTSRQEEKELSIISQSAQVVTELVVRIGSHFRRAEVRKRVGRYLQGLLASVERKNGWQMAEELGEANAHGVQRLLEEADWDEEAVRDELRTYVIEQLGEPGGMLVVDETGFVKKGSSQQGWRGSTAELPGAGRTARSGSFSCTPAHKGRPSSIARSICRKSGRRIGCVAARQAFPTRWSLRGIGELAQQMLARAFAAEVPAEWVVGDTIYGYDELRLWLEAQQKNYVLAVSETHQVWVQGRPQPVGLLAALLPDETEATNERARWVLIRRSLADRSERAYYRVYGPATITLAEVVRVTGSRWKIEEGYEQAKGEVGLDQYEVRTWRAWYRYVTLALLAYAALVVMQSQARAQEKKAESPSSGSS